MCLALHFPFWFDTQRVACETFLAVWNQERWLFSQVTLCGMISQFSFHIWVNKVLGKIVHDLPPVTHHLSPSRCGLWKAVTVPSGIRFRTCKLEKFLALKSVSLVRFGKCLVIQGNLFDAAVSAFCAWTSVLSPMLSLQSKWSQMQINQWSFGQTFLHIKQAHTRGWLIVCTGR